MIILIFLLREDKKEERQFVTRSFSRKGTMKNPSIARSDMMLINPLELNPDRLVEIPELDELHSPRKEPIINIKYPTSANVRVIARFRPINKVEAVNTFLFKVI